MRNVKNVDKRVSFTLLNKECYDSIRPVEMMSREYLKDIANDMMKSLDEVDIKESTAFALYYNRYDQSVFYQDYFSGKKASVNIDLNGFLAKLSTDSLGDTSVFKNAYLNFKCLSIYRHEWFMSGELFFSEDFYKVFLSKFSELIFNHYQYDSISGDFNSLPIVGDFDENIIMPHLLDAARCNVLYKHLASIPPTNDDILESERKMFLLFLQEVIKGQSILIINNYSI
jgi:hypothetical protein